MNQFNIMDFGAKPECNEAQTEAIQQAIDAADKNSGTVIVPAGIFKTGTLNLKGASLCLEKGATLLGSERKEDYYFNGYIHGEFNETVSLIYSFGSSNISIYGEGKIDLNGKSFFDFTTHILPEGLEEKFSEEQKNEATAEYVWRPNQPLFFHKCNHISVKGITILDAPCWTLTFSECDQILVDGITNIGHPRIPNNDGIHITSSSNVRIANCDITSADDCIAVTSITNWSKASENITITNCIFKSFSKAIVLGFVHSIVRNVVISNCVIKESNRAFCIMTNPGTGLVENVTVSNMRLDTCVRAGNWWGNGEPIMVFALPHSTSEYVDYSDEYNKRNYNVSIRNIYFQNIICTSENAIGIVGEDGNVQNISLDNVYVVLKESRNRCIKGDIFDVAPSPKTVGLPKEDACIMCVCGAKDIYANRVTGVGAHGQAGCIIMED